MNNSKMKQDKKVLRNKRKEKEKNVIIENEKGNGGNKRITRMKEKHELIYFFTTYKAFADYLKPI